MKLIERKLDKLCLAFAGAIMVGISAFIAYKNAKIDMLFSDAISDNNLLQAPFVFHDISIQAIHTHLLKWPIAILENTIGFNVYTHTVTSFLLLLAMNVGILYLCYRFSKKNLYATALCTLVLISVELMTGISANEGTLTMITIRNIELPITIALILFLVNRKWTFSPGVLLAILLLAVVFVTDQLLLFTSIIGIVLYYLYGVVKNKQLLSNIKDDASIYIGFLSAAVLSKVISVGFDVAGLASFFALRNTNEKLTYVASFTDLFNVTLSYIGEIFEVFGAGVFGKNIFDGWLYAINIIFLLITTHLIIKFLTALRSKRKLDKEEKVIFLSLLMFFFAMLVFTIIIPRETAGRYFAFLPVIGLLLVAIQGRKFRIAQKYRTIPYFTLAAAALLIFFFFMVQGASRVYYNQKYAQLQIKFDSNSKTVEILEKEKAGAYIMFDLYEQGYWYNQVIKQQYDEKTGKKLAIGSVFCDKFIVDRQFSRQSWVRPNGQKVAVHVRGCDIDKITDKLGQPSSTHELPKDGKILMYSTDIRGKLDQKQFHSDSFEK